MSRRKKAADEKPYRKPLIKKRKPNRSIAGDIALYLFLILLAVYISYRIQQSRGITERLESRPVILGIIWLIFMVEMVFRFFPSRLESPGCQK